MWVVVSVAVNQAGCTRKEYAGGCFRYVYEVFDPAAVLDVGALLELVMV